MSPVSCVHRRKSIYMHIGHVVLLYAVIHKALCFRLFLENGIQFVGIWTPIEIKFIDITIWYIQCEPAKQFKSRCTVCEFKVDVRFNFGYIGWSKRNTVQAIFMSLFESYSQLNVIFNSFSDRITAYKLRQHERVMKCSFVIDFFPSWYHHVECCKLYRNVLNSNSFAQIIPSVWMQMIMNNEHNTVPTLYELWTCRVESVSFEKHTWNCTHAYSWLIVI